MLFSVVRWAPLQGVRGKWGGFSAKFMSFRTSCGMALSCVVVDCFQATASPENNLLYIVKYGDIFRCASSIWMFMDLSLDFSHIYLGFQYFLPNRFISANEKNMEFATSPKSGKKFMWVVLDSNQ